LPQHRNGKERVFIEEKEVRDRGAGDLAFFCCSIRNGRIEASNISDDDDDRVIEMTGGGGLLVTLVIDFYVNDDNDNDEESRVGIHTRATLLIVDELHIHADGGVSFSLSLRRYYCCCCCCCSCCLLMMMRETESNDDTPGGRGTQRNATIKRATKNRTGEHDKANVRTTPSFPFYSAVRFFLSFFFFFLSFLFFFFFFFFI